MECIKIENLTFTYPDRTKPALKGISLSVENGDFITICGKSGCGKTTLLRLLKPSLAPFGSVTGNVFFNGNNINEISHREHTSNIGFVMQNPDSQIVTDKVWHELAFGLESLGYSTEQIRARVSEMASFFGIQTWFRKKMSELSGGQKQLLNLASVMVMQPRLLVLDEPTSRLDPIACDEFINMLKKINTELGTTIIMAEHRLDSAFSASNRVVVMDEGRIFADSTPEKVGKILKDAHCDMYTALPAPMRIFGDVENGDIYPVTVNQGRNWLSKYCAENPINKRVFDESFCVTQNNSISSETAIQIKDVHFRYDKNQSDVIKGLDLNVKKGELLSIVGGNGVGKTTLLSLISGINKPYRGELFIFGKKPENIKNLYGEILGVLPQNPQTLFSKKTVYLELLDMLRDSNLKDIEKENKIIDISKLCRISDILQFHPFDISGGEQQRVALAKILLLNPEMLLLDEPTKGMDEHFKMVFASVLKEFKQEGKTIVLVSHDIEFCAEFSDRCAMIFDGIVTSAGSPREFFSGNAFYTTSANKMARDIIPYAVLTEDIILALGKQVTMHDEPQKNKLDVVKKETTINRTEKPKTETHCAQKSIKQTIFALLFVLVVIPLTIVSGWLFLDDRKYYTISMLVIIEILIPFFMMFEGRKPKTSELVLISSMCAIAVAMRIAFYFLPQFKPVMALVIISGLCFGGETGFLIGAVTAFVSNFFFGQSPLTPWQMFGFGIVGYIFGAFFARFKFARNKLVLSILGGVATIIIYGFVVNTASVILWQSEPTYEMFVMSYLGGFPYDLVHAVSTSVFLYFLSEPFIEKLERVKTKYGLNKTQKL